ITFSNLVMDNVTGPVSMRLGGYLGYLRERKESLPIGTFRNVLISNIRARVAENSKPIFPNDGHEGEQRSCISITGIPGHNIEGITLSNIHITFPGGGTRQEAARRQIPELRDEYPEYFMFGILPCYGLYARHVTGLTLHKSCPRGYQSPQTRTKMPIARIKIRVNSKRVFEDKPFLNHGATTSCVSTELQHNR
ncbi:unnamed protein product, partial [marine sediment metagenome]